jgi:hypothetical protein
MVNKNDGQMPLGEFPLIPLEDENLKRLEEIQAGIKRNKSGSSTKAGPLPAQSPQEKESGWLQKIGEFYEKASKTIQDETGAALSKIKMSLEEEQEKELERRQKIEKFKQEASKAMQAETNAALAKLKMSNEQRDSGQRDSGLLINGTDPMTQFIRAGQDTEKQALYRSPEELLRQLGENEAKQTDSSFIRNSAEGTSEALAVENVSIREHLMRLGMSPDEITNRSTPYSSAKAMELASRDSNFLEKIFGIKGRYNKQEVDAQLKRMMVNSGAAENLTRLLENRAQRMASPGMDARDRARLDNINAGMIQAAEIAGGAFTGTNIGYRLWNGADESGNVVGGGFNVAATFYEAMESLQTTATSQADYLEKASQLEKQYRQEMEAFVAKISEAAERNIEAADIKQMRDQLEKKFKEATAFGLTGTGQRANAITGNLNDVEAQMILGRKKMYDRAMRFINDLQAASASVNLRRETRRREEQKNAEDARRIRLKEIRDTMRVYPSKPAGAKLWPL